MTARIENVLAPRDPSLTDENDWEEFSLKDVKVQLPGKSRYANLLSASDEFPVTVTGRLDIVEEEQEHFVLNKNYRSKRVVVEHVTHYAYGQHEDGEVGIWAACHAGWLAISPAKGYRPMFNEMVEAIDLLYFLEDKHQSKRRKKKQWNPKVHFLLQEYTKHTHGACDDAEDAEEVFDKHHEFLILQMLHDREGVDWPVTPIYAHFRDKFPDEFQRLEAIVRASNNDESESRSEGEETRAEEVENAVEHEPESAEDEKDNAEDEKAQADTIFEVILDMKESGLLSKRRLNIRTLAEALLKRYEMESVDYALDLIRARAGYIIEMMDNAQTSTFDWSRKVIYEELKFATNVEGLESMGTTPLHPRPVQEEDSSSSSEDSYDEIQIPKGRRRRVRKSLLRPKLSSVSAKGAGKRTRQPDSDMSDSDPDIGGPLFDDETPSKVQGHRLLQDALATKVNENVRSMTSHSGTPSLNHTRLQDMSEFAPSLNLRNREAFAMSSKNADPILPPDTWVCPVHGCGRTVLKASSKRSKEIITDHSLMHADDTQTKLDLVLAEQCLNVNVSVSHLLERIQGFGPLKDAHQETLQQPSVEEDSSSPSRKKVKT